MSSASDNNYQQTLKGPLESIADYPQTRLIISETFDFEEIEKLMSCSNNGGEPIITLSPAEKGENYSLVFSYIKAEGKMLQFSLEYHITPNEDADYYGFMFITPRIFVLNENGTVEILDSDKFYAPTRKTYVIAGKETLEDISIQGEKLNRGWVHQPKFRTIGIIRREDCCPW